jgi:hypothetical protein
MKRGGGVQLGANPGVSQHLLWKLANTDIFHQDNVQLTLS